MKPFIVIALLMGAITTPCVVRSQDVFADIQASHINGNAPTNRDFQAFLKRDLTAYFKKQYQKPVVVRYDFLRNGATQSGVSYPKYYLWVTATINKKVATQGAVRVAAIDKKYFDVTDFFSIADLRKSPQAIDATFPLPVGVKIREHLKTLPKTKPQSTRKRG